MLPGRHYTVVDYGLMAWRRKWLLLGPMVAGLYVGLIISSRVPNIYQSEMLIQVVPQRVPDAYVRSTVTMRTEDRISSLEEQIKSRTELERLITQMDLYPAARQRLPMQDVIEIMRSRIFVETISPARGQDTDSFYVRFSYGDPKVATLVTEKLGALFIEVNQRDRTSLAQAADNFLQSQLADAKSKLEAQEQKLKLFRERNAGRLPTQMQFNMQAMAQTQQQINQLVEQIARDRDSKLSRERQIGDIENEPVVSAPPAAVLATAGTSPIGSSTTIGTTAQRVAQLREVIRVGELKWTEKHPDVVNAKLTLAELERQLAEETAAAEAAAAAAKTGASTPVAPAPVSADQIARRDRVRQYRTEIESLDRQIQFREAQEQRLRQTLGDFQVRIEQVPGLESEWIALTRDYDTQQGEYKDLLQKSAAAKLAAQLEQRQVGEQFRILDPARTPVRPTGVNRLEVNMMSAAIGLGFGVLLAALLEIREKSFRTATDVIEVFNLPVVATVPHLFTDIDRRRVRWRRALVSVAVAAVTIAGGYGVWALQLWQHLT